MSSWLLFARLILRPLWHEPLRTTLTALAVTLGVGVVVAIDLAGQAAAGSFHSSLESLAGKNDLVLTSTGGIDEQVLGRLVRMPYNFQFTARIEDFASVNGKGEALPFIGLDLIGGNVRSQVEDQEPLSVAVQMASTRPIYAGAKLGLPAGSRVRLLINDQLQDFTVAGVLKSRTSEIGENNVIVADIGLAQKVTGKTGKLDAIDVIVPAGLTLPHWRDLLVKNLPMSVSVEPQGSRTDENRKMLSAFRWNLHVLSYIALVVGAFLIYNTISISVVRRRNEIGILRALGAARSTILKGFLAEALFFGTVGSILGLELGRLMAEGAVKLVGITVQSLYVTSEAAPIRFSLSAIITGIGVGICVSLAAAIAPAIEASQIAPVEAMARGRQELTAKRRSRKTIWLALGCFVAAALCSKAPGIRGQPILAYFAAMLLVAGTATVIPNLVVYVTDATSRLVERLLGIEASIALRSLRASLGRTSVMVGALATAVAMTVSVGIMVGSFRETVWLWMNNELTADFFLRPAGSAAADRHPTISADIPDRIQQLPGVAAVDRFRVYPISYNRLPASLGGGETNIVERAATTRFLPGEDRDQILSEMPKGDYAIVSEPFANKHDVRVGSTVTLALGDRQPSFKVLGIYYDYSTERGFIVIDRHTLLKYLPDPASSNLAVYLKPGVDDQAVRRGIDAVIGGRGVLVFSNSRLRADAITIFDRTFRITYALEAVAVFVAVMGIAGSLLALIIDRRREFALIRFLGGAQGQIRSIILCEAGILGLLSNGIGLALGTLLSLILIFVINKQSFGWTIQFHWPLALLLGILTVVYAATVLAGLYPARTAMLMNPIEVIHEE